MSDLGNVFRQVRALVGDERRWRWPLLLALAAVVTGVEMAGAVLVFVLLALLASPGADVALPLVGDLAAWFPDVPPESLRIGLAAAVGAFFVVRFFVLLGRAYIQNRLVTNAGALLADDLLRGYLSMPYLFHTRRNSAELIRNTFSATQELVRRALLPMVTIAAELLVVLGLVAVLVLVSPLATVLVAVVLVPTVLMLQRVVQPRLKRLGREAHDASTATIAAVQQALGGIRDLKVLGRERAFADTHLRRRLELARAQHLAQTTYVLPRAFIETSLVLAIVVVFIVAMAQGQVVQDVLSTLGLFAYTGLRLQPSLQKVVEGLNELKFSSAVLDDLAADRQAIDAWGARVGSDTPGAPIPPERRFRGVIEFRDVEFAYDRDGLPALRDVDLTIRRGEFVGICGPTGGGKSTLTDLLVGLLPPTRGRISVDGEELGERPWWWWAQLGVVSQDVFLVDDTLSRNVAFGEETEVIDHARLARCLRRAQLEEVVANLPDGLETALGERGVRLSGGQRQRVAIARALYREPEVLVLDEGTSALDGATEAALVAAIGEAKRDHTLIAVAHRISTVRDADRILVVDEGRIVAEGTYEKLRAESHLFRALTP